VIEVNTDEPCEIVYSLYQHEYLGFLIEPHIVQMTKKGSFSLAHQKLFSVKTKEFAEFLDDLDYDLIKLLEECNQEFIVKKYHPTPIRPHEFFLKHYNPDVHKVIRPNIERRIQRFLSIMEDKKLFVMGDDGNPTSQSIKVHEHTAKVLFHFFKNEDDTHYFPTLKLGEERVEFRNQNAEIICESPAWLLLADQLINFEPDLDGKKLKPFLRKKFIRIPKLSEPTYYKKFVGPLIEKYNVHAEGFEIKSEQHFAKPVLKIENGWDNHINLVLYFNYGDYEFPYNSGSKASVKLEQNGEEYIFHKVKRALDWERHKVNKIIELGLVPGDGSAFILKGPRDLLDIESPSALYAIYEWLNANIDELERANIEVMQPEEQTPYYIGETSFDLEISENNDWFDVHAIVRFGEFEVPFFNLRKHILDGNREYKLPNGQIAIIPESWFTEYNGLFEFAENGQGIRLKKHHFGMVKEIEEGNLAKVSYQQVLQELVGDEVEDIAMPVHFKGELRPYQKEGYNWFSFLRSHHFGGCLADDMGLGKTIQTLALLQKVKEEETDHHSPTLIVMPTSLIYNWQNEAKKFTPKLKVFAHIGTNRLKHTKNFHKYDIILTTYGTIRLDVEFIKQFCFNYLILDESQVIKNPASKITKAVKELWCNNKLILSGTPVENSVVDLWSQMSFLNPGLLGGITYFKNNFAVPIERKKDEDKVDKLQKIIRPFVLRRTKDQVASELPDKMEHVYYSTMSKDQEDLYEETKSLYRNQLLEEITTNGMGRSHISILQGLTKLRQIANHPKMVDSESAFGSGKFDDVISMLQNVMEKGHKVLVFSQFTKHLALFREYLDQEDVHYSYLDGSTKNRGQVVDEFKSNEDIRLFLISIKAGGVGLNLTEADYVFILDPWWNPATEQQAIDRTHRIGQDKNVFIYKFITKNSVEEKILALQKRKSKLAKSLISTEDTFLKSLTEDDLKDILS
jgi:superfamily II DNA or RNA helicase